jgi:molecular chaperone GrpE (heat shock protein)
LKNQLSFVLNFKEATTMENSVESKLLYTDVLECVLEFIDALENFNEHASPEELQKFSELQTVRERLHNTLNAGIKWMKAENEKIKEHKDDNEN